MQGLGCTYFQSQEQFYLSTTIYSRLQDPALCACVCMEGGARWGREGWREEGIKEGGKKEGRRGPAKQAPPSTHYTVYTKSHNSGSITK